MRPGHSVRPKIRLTESGTDLITILRCFLSFKTVCTTRNIIVFKIFFRQKKTAIRVVHALWYLVPLAVWRGEGPCNGAATRKSQVTELAWSLRAGVGQEIGPPGRLEPCDDAAAGPRDEEPAGLEASAAASAGETDRDLAATQFLRNCVAYNIIEF